MTRRPEWQKDGWAPAGPGQCRCPRCGTRVNTNAYARRAHERACCGRTGETPVPGPAQKAAEERRAENAKRPAPTARNYVDILVDSYGKKWTGDA